MSHPLFQIQFAARDCESTTYGELIGVTHLSWIQEHEPECPHSGNIGHCITCAVARSAYKRGREDASKKLRVLQDALAKVAEIVRICEGGRGYVPGRAVIKGLRGILNDAARGGEQA